VNVFAFLLENVDPNAIVIQSREECVTYGELITQADEIAATLFHLGIRHGQRVGIIGINSAFWVASYLAILKIGATAVPFATTISVDSFRERVELTNCQAYCAAGRHFGKYLPTLPVEVPIVLPDSSHAIQSETDRDFRFPGEGSRVDTVPVSPKSDLAALMFTSGSTGKPNAVKVTHQNIIANTNSIIEYIQLSSDDRMMVVMPLEYCFAASLLHTHLRTGGQLVFNNRFHFTEEVLDDMEHFGCTGFAGVPYIYHRLLDRSSLLKRQMATLRHVQQAGGKLDTQYISRFVEGMPHIRFFVMYGQTEATARLSFLPPERLHDKLGSIGRGIPGVRLSVLDSAENPVPIGETGEIVAEGDNITAGYLVTDEEDNPFRDGKLYTGDLARIDDEGFIYVVGRKKDFIKPYGYRIACSEIEQVLMLIEGINEAAVLGVPHGEFGEVAHACIVLAPDVTLTDATVIAHCRQHLPFYGVPVVVTRLEALPRNASGKLIKQELKALIGV
jgi:long-chain acyl-CoA synthetase